MFDPDEPKTKAAQEIIPGCDLSTFSVEDIDERIEILDHEITRLREERKTKAAILTAAEQFFKS